jgi:hypothetical protein
MYLITLKVSKIKKKMFASITKVNEWETNRPCSSTLEVTYSSVEKLSKALVTKGPLFHEDFFQRSNLQQFLT